MRAGFSNIINHINFGHTKIPVYKIDKDGNYKKYGSISQASKDDNGDVANIYKCVRGEMPIYRGNVYCAANVIENKGVDIETSVKNEYEKRYSDKNYKVYAIDLNGNMQKFATQVQMSQELNIPIVSISSNIRERTNVINDKVFLKKEQVVDENGNFNVEKLEKIVAEKFFNTKKAPIYAVAKDNTYKRYDSILDCANEQTGSVQVIGDIILNNRRTKKEYVYIKAEDVEHFKLGKGFVVDEEKLLDLAQEKRIASEEHLTTKRCVPIYSIDKDGNFEKFVSIQEACDKYNINRVRIDECLRGSSASSKDTFFVLANKVEELDENNELVLNRFKAAKMFLELKKRSKLFPLCVVNRNGSIQTKLDLSDLCKMMKIDKSEQALLCKQGIIEKDGVYYLDEIKVQVVEPDGTIKIDNQKIQEKIIECQKNKRKKYIYAVDKNFNYEVFENINQAVKRYHGKRPNINMCLTGKSKSALGKVFVYADKVEAYDGENKPYFNYDRFINVLKERDAVETFLNGMTQYK